MPFKRKFPSDDVIALPKEVGRYARLDDDDLVAAIEASIGNSAEVFRGFSHSEVDTGWVVAQLEAHMLEALGAVRTLRERHERRNLT